MPSPRPTALTPRTVGLLCLVVTSTGWGINWPAMKLLLREWPPLFARGIAGLAAAALLALVAWRAGERFSPPRSLYPRLAAMSFVNVFAWMGFTTLSLRWLAASEGALVVYTMPIWAMLLAWPLAGRRPRGSDVAALALCIAGTATLFAGGELSLGGGRLPGVLFALAAAILFALGTVVQRPLGLPPFTAVAAQLAIGCAPMIVLALLFEHPRVDALSPLGIVLMVYMTIVPMGVCYLTWFAALRRLPAETAAVATLLTPIIGVAAAAIALREPFGTRQVIALGLTVAGLALVIRKR